jgi:hypothetical protein
VTEAEQQKQDDEERMELTLIALRNAWNRGLHDEALFLASECGLTKQFRQLTQKAA